MEWFVYRTCVQNVEQKIRIAKLEYRIKFQRIGVSFVVPGSFVNC